MNSTRPSVFAPVLFTTMVFLCGCDGGVSSTSTQPQIVELRGLAMGTEYSIKVLAESSSDGASRSLQAEIDAELAAVNHEFSTYQDDTVVSQFNAAREDSEHVHRVGGEFVDLVAMALRVAEMTRGAFDPTVLPLMKAYPLRSDSKPKSGSGTSSGFPEPAEVAAAQRRVGYLDLELVPPDGIRKRRPDVELDTNSFAKGYGVDRIAELLMARGVESFLVEIGGEVRCGGTKPDGVPWRIGVEKPSADGSRAVSEAVEVRDEAIATSGDYRQFAESVASGERVHHILDPRTGANPSSSVVSVSVRAPTCAVADALATALMVMGDVEGRKLLDAWTQQTGDAVGALFLLRRARGASVDPGEATTSNSPAAVDVLERVGIHW